MTLSPCGKDKYIIDDKKAKMSNSGVTIMKLLEMEHLLVKTLGNIVEYYKMNDNRLKKMIVKGLRSEVKLYWLGQPYWLSFHFIVSYCKKYGDVSM